MIQKYQWMKDVPFIKCEEKITADNSFAKPNGKTFLKCKL